MRVERVRIGAFGGLRELDTGDEALPGLVVVRGPNEAGKTTFFHFMTSLLYGFYPATRDAHPYTPWSGGDAEGAAWLRLSDGTAIEVHRRLLSSPTGSVVRGVRTEDLRNQTLPFAEHVPRTVFRQVYALTLAELSGIEGEGWERIQDRLVGAMGARDILSVRPVADALEREAGELWRPNRRGKQKARELRERVRELRGRRQEAVETDRRLREMVRERDRLDQEIRAAREKREACRVYVERYRALLPIRDQLVRIEALEEEAGPPEELEGIPADPADKLRELRRRSRDLEDRLRDLEASSAPPREHVEAFGTAEAQVLEHREEVERLVARVAGQQEMRVRAAQLEQELKDLDRRAGTLARDFLKASPPEVDREALDRLAPADVREAVRSLVEAREERRTLEAASAMEETSRASRVTITGASVLLALGGVLMVAGVLLGSVWAGLPGAAVFGAGVVLALLAPRRSGEAPLEERLSRTRANEEKAAARLASLLEGLPVSPSALERTPHEVASGLERLQEMLRDREERADERERIARELREAGAAMIALGSTLGLTLPLDPSAAAHFLDGKVREADQRKVRAADAHGELQRLERERERMGEELKAVREARVALEARLLRLADGDAEAGVQAARSRMDARDRARRLSEELERGHPDLPEIRERIRAAEAAGEDWVVDDEAIARRRVQADELSEIIESKARRQEALEGEVDHLGREDTVAGIDGEIAALEEEIERVVFERDRRFVLARVLREADRRFREEHQPELVRRAGEHLGVITGGRYDRILFAENGTGRGFRLRGGHLEAPVDVAEPISTATREQVYLALRLAIVDHLDRHGERLPLFLDEAFVNWDRRRRGRGLDQLSVVAEHRQVFLFTCHEDLAEELAARGGRVVELAGPVGAG
ncbi:MAG: AAA family ATPase [Gemmatimonadetes bacterium]|nr:AAA family ATPase [Gemmatimonadota bacterium]